MSQLPSLRAREVIKILQHFGFEVIRQKGSHVVLKNDATGKRIVLPNHPSRTVKKPLLQKIIEKEAEMKVEEFLNLRRK